VEVRSKPTAGVPASEHARVTPTGEAGEREHAGDADPVRVQDLVVQLVSRATVFDILRGVSLTVEKGSTLAVVGESGSGKSMLALSLMGLLPKGCSVVGGSIAFSGRQAVGLTERAWRDLRGEFVAMVFQDPLTALNPSLTVGAQVAEIFRYRRSMSRSDARAAALQTMTEVGIPDAARRFDDYPHRFSGGMRQRAVIAMAIALEPALLIADEPTTALDVTIQAQLLRLLAERSRARGMAMIIISHDLGVVARVAKNVAVMYAGRVVEAGSVGDVYTAPAHPYTLGLINAAPNLARGRERLRPITGNPPSFATLPSGCAFHPRCPIAQDRCAIDDPPLRLVAPGHASACHFAESVLEGSS
jgi:oligopeptide transport system ATP-binding protein